MNKHLQYCVNVSKCFENDNANIIWNVMVIIFRPNVVILINIFSYISQIFTVGPNGPKLRSWEHIWAYLCKELYSHHFWPDDSEWGYKKLNEPNWPSLTFIYLEMALENIFFSACPSFNHTFSPKLCENEKSAPIRFWARHYRIDLQKNRYKKFKNEKCFWRSKWTYVFSLLLPDIMYALPR